MLWLFLDLMQVGFVGYKTYLKPEVVNAPFLTGIWSRYKLVISVALSPPNVRYLFQPFQNQIFKPSPQIRRYWNSLSQRKTTRFFQSFDWRTSQFGYFSNHHQLWKKWKEKRKGRGKREGNSPRLFSSPLPSPLTPAMQANNFMAMYMYKAGNKEILVICTETIYYD